MNCQDRRRTVKDWLVHSATLLVLLVTAGPLSAQPPNDASPPKIDVASIKPSRPDATASDLRMSFPPGRVEITNATLSEIVLSLTGFGGELRGAPNWMGSER